MSVWIKSRLLRKKMETKKKEHHFKFCLASKQELCQFSSFQLHGFFLRVVIHRNVQPELMCLTQRCALPGNIWTVLKTQIFKAKNQRSFSVKLNRPENYEKALFSSDLIWDFNPRRWWKSVQSLLPIWWYLFELTCQELMGIKKLAEITMEASILSMR